MQTGQVSLLLLAALLAVTCPTGHTRSYSYSYSSPNGQQARYEVGAGHSVDGGYRYVSPEGGLVAVRYSNDPSGNFLQPLTASERRFSAATGALPDPYGDHDPSRRSQRRHSFSYVLPDGHSRYESWDDGEVVGGYRYTSPEGSNVAVRYTAGKNGFRPVDVSSEVRTGPLVGGPAPATLLPAAQPVLQTARAFPVQVQPQPTVAVRPPVAFPTYPTYPYYVWRHLYDDDDHDDFDDDDLRALYYRQAVAAAAAQGRPQQPQVYAYPTARAAPVLQPAAPAPAYYPYAFNPFSLNQYAWNHYFRR